MRSEPRASSRSGEPSGWAIATAASSRASCSSIAACRSGAVLVEYTFGLNGLGALLIQAVRTKDFAVVQAITLMMVVAFVLINMVVDLVYALLDPRVAKAGAR